LFPYLLHRQKILKILDFWFIDAWNNIDQLQWSGSCIRMLCWYLSGKDSASNTSLTQVYLSIYIWGFLYLDYFFDVLISWSRKLSLYHWFCLHSVLSILLVLCCFLSLRDNSSCMNVRYDDVRYRVYIWAFSYLDYSFDVLISLIRNLGLYNWFYHIYHTWYLIPAHVCLYSWHNFQYILFDSDLSVHMYFSMHTIKHSSHHSLGCLW